MKKGGKDNEYRRIRIESQYQGYDFFLLKKPMQCAVKIPETVLLDKNGAVKQWIFNSHKLPQHPILKKRRENLLPFAIIRHFCCKQVSSNHLSSLKTIHDLKDTFRTVLLAQKDAQFTSKKKHIEIRTVDNDILQVNILEFLDYVGQNKFAQQNFYDKWRMIQQRVSSSKLDESYLVESVRKNHIIESKSSKYIAINTGQRANIDSDSNDPFKQAMPSKQLQVVQTKVVEGYKFFDTYLNKKFFTAVQQIIDCIQKNYKCLVESITTRFVIDQDRQPHLAAIQQIYLKPTAKLYEMREFGQYIIEGTMKLQNYTRCLQQFVLQNPSKPELNLEEPLSQQRRNRCRGDFCDISIDFLPHIQDPKIKLPSIGRYNAYNARQMSNSLIECVKKRKRRVIEKLKQNGVLDSNFQLNEQDSSEYEDSDDERDSHVRVCEHCFIFYINVLKYFELDPFNNLVEKKQAATVRTKTLANSQKILQKSIIHKEENKQQEQLVRYKSLKTLHNKMKIIEDRKQAEAQLKRSVSQHTKLRPIEEVPNKFDNSSLGKQDPQQKKISLTKDKHKIIGNSNKLIEAKLKNVASQEISKKANSLASNIAKGSNSKKNAKPNNFYQAAEQLIDKLELIKSSNQQEFVVLAKKYYSDNLPQYVDRVSYSNHYMTNLYEFMSISPIGLAAGNRIKKRPQMSLKRLSQLTNYPQIVSRSTFHFDTLICDEKTTIPFCIISTKMIHNNNKPGVPYKNIVLVNDIFDSYIQYISMVKQILEEAQNTRFILFNYHGQSHTIYDKAGSFQGSDFACMLDKLLYRLGTYQNQLNIINPGESISFVGYGFGGYLVQCYLSMCPHMHDLVPKVLLFNSPNYLTKKYKEIFTSLRQLYSVDDKVTEENSFLFYNKAINSIQIEKQDLENKSGLNSIRLDGRAYLLNNSILYWNDTVVDNFIEYNGKVIIIYSKNDILMTKQDLQSLLYRPDADRTILKNRALIQIDGGHDIAAENYNEMIKNIYTLVQ